MWNLPVLILLFLILPVSPVFATKHLVYFGGGNSAVESDAMFDQGLKDMMEYADKASWKSEFYFRKSVPKEMSAHKDRIKTFTPETFQKRIEGIKADIRQGRIKAGEQLMLYLDSHGILDEKGNYLISVDRQRVETESLKGLIQLAEEKNIKLGIVGMTCYSGSLLRFKTANTCIVTIAPPDKVGFSDDSFYLSKNTLLQANKTNLEDVYLRSRRHGNDYYSPAQPMISTEAGIMADQALAPLKSGIYDAYDLSREQRQPVCRNMSLEIESLNQKLNHLAKVVEFSSGNLDLPAEYKGPGNIVDLKRVQKLQDKLKAYEVFYQETAKTSHLQNSQVCGKNDLCLRAFAADIFVPRSEEERRWLEEVKSSEAYKKYKAGTKNQETLLQRMRELSLEIAKEERDLYDQLYKLASQKTAGPNPCRDFKL